MFTSVYPPLLYSLHTVCRIKSAKQKVKEDHCPTYWLEVKNGKKKIAWQESEYKSWGIATLVHCRECSLIWIYRPYGCIGLGEGESDTACQDTRLDTPTGYQLWFSTWAIVSAKATAFWEEEESSSWPLAMASSYQAFRGLSVNNLSSLPFVGRCICQDPSCGTVAAHSGEHRLPAAYYEKVLSLRPWAFRAATHLLV